MLKDAILKINVLNQRENTISASFEINKNSEIFIGHFAGHPVLPGACMLQAVKEVLQLAFHLSFRLKRADYIKFLILIDPRIHNSLELRLTYRTADESIVDVMADFRTLNDICFKFKGSFVTC